MTKLQLLIYVRRWERSRFTTHGASADVFTHRVWKPQRWSHIQDIRFSHEAFKILNLRFIRTLRYGRVFFRPYFLSIVKMVGKSKFLEYVLSCEIFMHRLDGLGVWFSLRVREVPGSNPGRAQTSFRFQIILYFMELDHVARASSFFTAGSCVVWPSSLYYLVLLYAPSRHSNNVKTIEITRPAVKAIHRNGP